MYYVVWCIIVYSINNFIIMMVLFFYIIMFSIQITIYRSIPRYFYSDLSVIDRPDFISFIPFLTFSFFVTNRIKTYMSKNSKRIFFLTISHGRHPTPHAQAGTTRTDGVLKSGAVSHG
jgi:hypothetical protein